MSKLAICLVGAGVVGASAVGVALFKPRKVSESHPNTKKPLEYNKNLETVEGFKKSVQDGCFYHVFAANSLGDAINDDSVSDHSGYFNFSTTADNIRPAGCLWVQSNTTGTFSWVGTLSVDTEGLAVFGTAKKEGDKGNLKVSGIMYALKKQTHAHPWTIEGKKQVDEKTISKEQLDNNFPKAKVDNLEGSPLNEYWNGPNKDNLGESDSSDSDQISQQHQWTWEKGDDGKSTVYEGCENLDGFKNMFGFTYLNLEANLNSFKGSGIKYEVTT